MSMPSRPSQSPNLSPWATGAIALAVAIAAIGAYHFLLRQSEREAAMETVREAAAAMQAQKEQEQTQAVAQALREERLRQGFLIAAALRTWIAEYLATQGRLPQSLDELRFDLPYDHVLQSLEIGPGGAIVMRFLPQLGLDGTVTLTPNANLASGMIRNWDCVSADFDFISRAMPGCIHIGSR
ncbi:MAG: pilin [Comamonadaceae bacterium]|nr:pilin [Comamonadaceae bacterium]